jgi:membrane protease YdiL (CAAX protease family)
MVIAANAAVGKPWAHHATGILAGLLAGATFLFGAFDYASASSGPHNPFLVDVGIMVTAVAAATLASKPVRERAARIIPIDPDNPVHSIALVLAVILLGTQVASIAFSDVLAADQQLPPLGIGDLVGQEAPFLVFGLVGVGLLVRRDLGGSLERLGIVRPAWWHIALALAAAGLFFGFQIGAASLSEVLTPTVANQVNKTSQHLFGALTDPWGIVALAVIPGICEETLFRGALQPRLGLVVTAVLFTAIHTEYGLSIDVVTIFVIAIGLGLIRKYTNTTASGLCHIAYNLLVGVTVAVNNVDTPVVVGAVAVEIAVIALAAYGIRTARRVIPEPLVESADVR